MTDLIYNVTRMRLYFPTSLLQKHTDIVASIINELSRKSGKNGPLNTKEVCNCFCSNFGKEDFSSEEGSKRPWLSSASVLGQAISNVIENDQIPELDQLRERLYKKFEKDYESSTLLERKAQSVVYMGCFAGNHALEFVNRQIQYFNDLSEDPIENQITISSICLSLSCLKMNKDLATKLCFVGLSLAFYEKQSSSCAMDLIANSIRNYGSANPLTNTSKGGSISQELMEYIETCTDLPFRDSFYYCLYLMIAQFCDKGNAESVARAITGTMEDDAYFALIRCIYDSSTAQDMATLDYGPSLAAVEAAAVLIFKHAPGLAWDVFLEKITDSQAEGYKSFDSGYPEFAKGVAEAAKSPHLMGLLTNMRAMKGGEMDVPAVLLSNFSEEDEPIQLSNEQIQYLVLTLFPQ